jgi:hypothetical protein
MLRLGQEYSEIEKEVVKEQSEKNPSLLFQYNLQKKYPEFCEIAAKKMAEKESFLFFRYKLNEYYPQYLEIAATDLSRNNPTLFFRYNLSKIFPNLTPKEDPLNSTQYKLSSLYKILLKKGYYIDADLIKTMIK